MEKAYQNFELARDHARKSGNMANAQIIQEAQHCMTVWMEKLEKTGEAPEFITKDKKKKPKKVSEDDMDDW